MFFWNTNKYCFKNLSRVDWDIFQLSDHHGIALRTRAISGYSEKDLFIESLPPIPIRTVKHLSEPENFIQREKLETDKYIQTRLESRIKVAFRAKKVFNEAQNINGDILEYIGNKMLKKTSYYNTTDTFDLNCNKGTLNYIEGDEYESLAYVWDSSSIDFFRLQNNDLIKIYSTQTVPGRMPNELITDSKSKFALVRYPLHIHLFEAPNYDKLPKKLSIKPIDSIRYKTEIVASSLQDKYLTTVNTKHRLSRFDLEHKFKHFSIKLNNYFVGPISPISVSDHIKANNRDNFITVTTRQSYSLFDCRVKKKYCMTKLFTHKDTMLFACERIMNHTQSLLDKNIVYISSSHLLYAFDHRNLKEPVVHWTHGLIKPALMLKTQLYGTKEVICVSSHKPDDFALFNYSAEYINYNPFKPIGLENVYNKFREEGQFLLSDTIPERIKANNTGIALQCDPISRVVNVFTQNFYGDIFKYEVKCQQKSSRNHEVNYQALSERYQNLDNFLSEKRNPNKYMSDDDRINHGRMCIDDIIRLDGISKILTGEKIPIIEADIDMLEPEKVSNPKPSWKINIHDARQYQDLLATEIMQVWDDIEMEEMRPDVFAAAIDASQNDQGKEMDKVSMWLKNNISTHNSIVNDSIDLLDSTVLTQDLPTQATGASTSTPALRSARKKPRLAGF
ncbi:hypothetical protein PVAND_000959 [Polypedilum vanderplanki]|uniref:Uncharacterized protein n=1 Tax=Polypedilum vanderplanki TaxID=319348 RepID=A0A9J6BMP4_POLVA|nr:hypothetical protein PVAND_000959 [Polypedilum vanderplanki]